MGSVYGFGALNILGELDEKYIKEADRYLSEPLAADAEVIRLAPERRKFSWKAFAAVAACAAVLVSGTAFMANYLKSRSPYDSETSNSSDDSVEISYTEEEQAYLDKWKDKLGASVNVAFAVDRLNFVEVDLPDDIGWNFIDENKIIFIRDNKTLEMYDVKEKTYSIKAEFADDGKMRGIVYSDKEYVILSCIRRTDSIWTEGDELYLYDVNDDQLRLIYAEETVEHDLVNGGNPLVADGKIYFDVIDNSDREDACRSLHVYDIASQTEQMLVRNAHGAKYYNGEIFYRTDEGSEGYKSLSTEHSFDRSVIFTKYGAFKHAYATSRFMKLDPDRIILSSYTGSENSLDGCDFMIRFDNGADESGLTFLYYAPSEEILVFQDNDGFENLTFFDWGAYISKTEPDGKVRYFIITENDNGNTVKIPRQDFKQPEIDIKQLQLDGVRAQLGIDESVGVAYVRDRLDVTRFAADKFDEIDTAKLFIIDSDRLIVPHRNIKSNIEMCYHKTNEYVTLISADSDPMADEGTLYEVRYTDGNYVIFSRIRSDGRSDLCYIDLNKEGYPCGTIHSSDENDVLEGVFINENTIYYASYGKSMISPDDRPSIYKYKMGYDEEAVLFIDEGVPLCVYNDMLLYYTMEEGESYWGQEGINLDKRIIHSDNPETKINGKPYTAEMWACKYGVFKAEGGKLIDCLTGKVILSSSTDLELSPFKQCDFGVVVGGQNIEFIYNACSDEVLVFEIGDDLPNSTNWKGCNLGICTLESDGYIISRKKNGIPMKETDISYSEYGVPRIYIPVNSDLDYPLNIRLEIDPDSIKFNKADEPVYGFDEFLDQETLDFVMKVSLKEGFYKYNKCTLNLNGYTATIEGDGVAEFPASVINGGGQFPIELLSDDMECDYGSILNIVVELDSTVVVEAFYQVAYEGAPGQQFTRP